MTASFEQAFNLTMKHEGLFSNDPDDRGGMTYCGISRKHHPDWNGWAIIDDFLEVDQPVPELELLVQAFYKKNYWDAFKGDDLPQAIANELFDTAVNMGARVAVKFLQKALNYANRNQALFPDIKVDGDLGVKTGTALNALINELDFIVALMNNQQGARYMSIVDRNPTQEKYLRGWFERTKTIKT